SREFDTARESAHAIKGASMMAGALQLAEVCQTIQRSIENNEHEAAVSCKAKIQENFDAYAEEVNLYMHSPAEVA
ncbi:MAG: Hpt domain-containing protein, partial [Rhodospirillaceae bacterium]|nr:Hpt domain-containing protein [Rhodospirillaceae bacterium]